MRITILHAEFQTLSRIRLKEILLKTEVSISYRETLNSKDLFQKIKALPPDVLIINYYEGATFCETDCSFVLESVRQRKIEPAGNPG